MRVLTALLILGVAGPTGASHAQPRDASARTSGTASIHGRVFEVNTARPLQHARVRVTRGDEFVSAVFTDGEGRFVVPALAAGAYRVAAAKSGYLSGRFGEQHLAETGTVIQVANGTIVDGINLHLQKAAAIAGRILDDLGNPVIGMTVSAETLSADGPDKPSTIVASTQLDDLGEYRIGGLPPGQFVVSVTVEQPVLGPNGTPFPGGAKILLSNGSGGRVGPDAFAAQTRTYYPGVPRTAESEAIELAAGQERSTVDFSVPAAPPRTWSSIVGGRDVHAAPGSGAIRGRVTRSDGRPLPSVPVRLTSDTYPGIPPSTATDADGRYELSGLPAATYRVIAERSGFLSVEYGQSQVMKPGESIALKQGESRERIDITMPSPGSIAGRVFDDYGDPVEGARVRILQVTYEAGRPLLNDAQSLGSPRTNDLGRYRVYGLAPGSYIVSVAVGQDLRGQPIADLPGYAPTYFPGTPNPGDAQWVSVDLSAQVTDIDMTLARVATARVAGTRFDEAGRPAADSMVLSPSRRSGSFALLPMGVRSYPDGRFEFPSVPPGEYVLQALTPRREPLANTIDEGEFASLFVSVNGIDVTGLIIQTSRGSTIKGHVTVEGRGEAWLWSEIVVSALPIDLDRSPLAWTPPANAGIRADWTFDLAGISGPRLLRVTSAPRGWTLKAVMLNGLDVTDTPLPFGTKDQSAGDVEIILTDRVSEISGTVTDARGRGIANCRVVVFATDRTLWGPATRFVSIAQSERDGVYSVRRLPAGEYYVAAVDRVIDGEWLNPELLESLVPLGTKVTLAEGDTVSTPARLILR